jgi:osmotically inducible lipoprotein OsmB
MSRIILVVASLSVLSACGDTMLERTVSGAAIGAGAAAVTGNDLATGAAVGAGAGVVSDIVR